ncbi:hypothetical protein BJ165DRAFT_733460 [Panaeolus papilionaceus]|nr:hypothetical protein BJ165DRAFT_733460 [Panaeolus papilionaceus]
MDTFLRYPTPSIIVLDLILFHHLITTATTAVVIIPIFKLKALFLLFSLPHPFFALSYLFLCLLSVCLPLLCHLCCVVQFYLHAEFFLFFSLYFVSISSLVLFFFTTFSLLFLSFCRCSSSTSTPPLSLTPAPTTYPLNPRLSIIVSFRSTLVYIHTLFC